MRNWFKTTMAAIAVVLMTGLSTSVFGVASFARQTGLDCTSCHSELGYPTLNSFGAAFKAGGYTTGADENFIGDGESLSIPKNLNFSGVVKFRYASKSKNTVNAGTKGTATTSSEYELPDEAVLFIGGRIGKNIGWVVEAPADAWAALRIAFVTDIGGMKLGVVPFWTDGHGPGWSFETLSTGNAKHLRAAEIKEDVSAQVAVNWGGITSAHGLGVYLWSPMFFINYAAVNNSDAAAGNSTNGIHYGHYIRGAFTPTFGGLEAGIGFSMLTGQEESVVTGTPSSRTLNYIAVDAQLQGNVGIPLGVYITYAADKQVNDAAGSTANDLSSFALFVEAGLIPGKLQLGLGYSSLTNGAKGSTVTGAKGAATITAKATEAATRGDLLVVAKYFLNMNMRLNLEFAYNLEAGAYTILPMLFGSF